MKARDLSGAHIGHSLIRHRAGYTPASELLTIVRIQHYLSTVDIWTTGLDGDTEQLSLHATTEIQLEEHP